MRGPLRQPERQTQQSPRSWWLEPHTREDFAKAVIRETLRMNASIAYGQVKPMTVGEVK